MGPTMGNCQPGRTSGIWLNASTVRTYITLNLLTWLYRYRPIAVGPVDHPRLSYRRVFHRPFLHQSDDRLMGARFGCTQHEEQYMRPQTHNP